MMKNLDLEPHDRKVKISISISNHMIGRKNLDLVSKVEKGISQVSGGNPELINLTRIWYSSDVSVLITGGKGGDGTGAFDMSRGWWKEWDDGTKELAK